MVKYKLTDIKAYCPVCGEGNGKLLYTVNSGQSASHFVLKELDEERFNNLRNNIKKLWQTENCKIIRCENCDFCYAYPFVGGDSNFYNLAFGEGGYPSWKFEYEMTFNAIKKLLESSDSNEIQLLEIGAGDGAFIKKVSPKFIPKKNIFGTEYSKYGINQIEDYGVRCIAKDFREMKDRGYTHKFAIICLFQVLEHLDSIDKIFQSLNFLSTKEANLFIAVPNAERIEFNEKNGALLDMPPNHIARWSKKCFEVICKKYQWKIVDYNIEPGELNSSLSQFSSYKYLRNRQISKSIDNRIATTKTSIIRRALERLIIKYYKITSGRLIKRNYRAIGNSQWIHLKKEHIDGKGVQLAEEQPLNISFVMPTYNSAATVAESVESITQGNFEDGDELIIVDGCSTDNTTQVLSDLKEKYHFLKLILNENYLGCPAARNVGIGTASNSIIFNLDSDNILVPGSIKRLKQFMIDEEADVAAFGELHYFQNDKNKSTHKWICRPGTLTLADLLSGSINPAPSGNYMFTKESWQRVGKYWEYGAGLNEAWGFSLKQIANGSKFVVMPGSYYLHRFGYSSLYMRESAKKHKSSLMATKMIKPFINLLDDEDAKYILSEKGSREWFDNLGKRPIKLKSGEICRTGKVVDANGNPLTKKPSKFQILRAKVIGALSHTLPSSIKDIIRGKM